MPSSRYIAGLAIATFPQIISAVSMVLDSQIFKGDLAIRDLYISDAFEAEATSSYNGTLNVIVVDEDCLEVKPTHCQIEWKAGVSPPSKHYPCENSTMRTWFPDGTFKGVKDFQLQFAHTVIDTSIGPCPRYCYLTKYAAVNLTYPGTPHYDCDTENAICEQLVNTTIKAPVYLSIG